LQNETRAYVRKDGKATTRGPYWFYKFHTEGHPFTLYLGKTDDPEGVADEKLEQLRREYERSGESKLVWDFERMVTEHDEALGKR
jgi:hypothetical protein